jgi:ribosomal protein L9
MPLTELILTENVPGLGAEADVVKVRRGYARNYLLPRGMAYEVTPGALRQLDALKQKPGSSSRCKPAKPAGRSDQSPHKTLLIGSKTSLGPKLTGIKLFWSDRSKKPANTRSRSSCITM